MERYVDYFKLIGNIKMKNLLSTTALLAAITAGDAVSAQEMAGDWYGSVFGGYSTSSDLETSYTYVGEYTYTAIVTQGTDPGYILGVTVGTSVAPNLRVEAELSYAKYVIGDFNVSASYGGDTSSYGGTSEGEESTTYLLANVWLDLPNMGGGALAVPYIGGGLGGAKVRIVDGVDQTDTVIAYQIGAGLQFPLGAGMIDVGYRFKGTGKTEFTIFGDTTEWDEVYSNNLQVGYVMKF